MPRTSVFMMGHVFECWTRVPCPMKPKGCGPQKCGVRWPCQDSDVSHCVRDYHSDVCPVVWRRSGNDCVAPGNYVGCHSVHQFSRFVPSDKRAWESACGAHFFCASSIVIRESDRFHRNHDNPCVVSYIIFFWCKICFSKKTCCKSFSIVVFRVG